MEMGAFMQAARMCHVAMLSLDGQVRAMAEASTAKPGIITH
jgi:hypothetical protein